MLLSEADRRETTLPWLEALERTLGALLFSVSSLRGTKCTYSSVRSTFGSGDIGSHVARNHCNT